MHNAISPNVVMSMGRTFLIMIKAQIFCILNPLFGSVSLKVLVLIRGVFLQRTKLIWNLKLPHVILGRSFAVD